ncbi:FIST signal transduction protein [Siccirubricoccus deserti]|uniref:FIST signal transduction protein n=1 Tax=Siccirubricoccus deserti TaxID=2013562 RepID=UPI001C983083|nr:FIST N-terminal domain-containing protein [Siccirubricoccus deserti]
MFASPRYAHQDLLQALVSECPVGVLVGASSAGEFARNIQGEGMACALALKSAELRFAAGIGRNLREDPAAAARGLTASFRGMTEQAPHRAALVLTDALAGHAQALLDELTLATVGQYQFFGGGAGDDAQFRRTVVFHGTEVLTDAAVTLEILSPKPLGIGVGHGWEPASPAFRVTKAEGLRLIGLNGLPAVEAFEAHAERLGQTLDRQAPVPFFLQNILGVDTGAGYRLRVPLAIDEAGAVLCAAEVPVGSRVRIMCSTAESTVVAAERATAAALAGLGGHRPKVALFFDCVATRLRLGDAFATELDAVRAQITGVPLVGCNTHGQIARAEGQFEGFHNCTAVVCVLPE